MNLIKKIIGIALVFVCTSFLFVGCTARKYELIGVVFEGDSEVTLLNDITDEAIKENLVSAYQSYIYIDLNQDGSYSMGYTVKDNDLTIEYTQTGTYKIDEDNQIITFSNKKSDGSSQEFKHQYTNGMIIYYDPSLGIHLAFK